MAGKIGQAAGRAASRANEVGNKKGPDGALQKGAKRDPELYVRYVDFLRSELFQIIRCPDSFHHYDVCFWHGGLPFWHVDLPCTVASLIKPM